MLYNVQYVYGQTSLVALVKQPTLPVLSACLVMYKVIDDVYHIYGGLNTSHIISYHNNL